SCAPFYFLVQFGYLNFTLQQTGTGHEDGVICSPAQLVGLGSVSTGVIKIADIKIQKAAILHDTADAVMMFMQAVDFFCLVKICKGVAAQFRMLPQLALLVPT